MPFLALEKLGKKPVALYTFARDARVWRYASAQKAVTAGSVTYQPAVISHGDVTDSDEESQATVTITLSRGTQVVSDILEAAPSYQPVFATILRYQAGATDVAREASGEVVSVRHVGDGKVEVVVALSTNALSLPVPRLTYQRTCNHNLYDTGCGVDPTAFTFAGTVVSVDGATVIVSGDAAAKDADYFTAGLLIYDGAPAMVALHTVDDDTNAVLAIMGPLPPGIAVDATVAVRAGCRRRFIEDCVTKFDNAANFWGFPDMPDKDPFEKGVL